MMGRLFTVVFFVMLLIACSGIDRPEKPDGLLAEDAMVDLLYDINLVSAAQSTLHYQLLEKQLQPDSFLYKKYGLDSLQIANNIAYYASEFSTYIRIQEQVNDRLTSVQDSLREYQERLDSVQIYKQQHKNDNIRKNTLQDSTAPQEAIGKKISF
ncbi:MAG: DUF4296 domain-containing protein [Leeuwenhoekiella sp.]